jgi:ComF family protein
MIRPPWLSSLADGLLDLVFPPVCVACAGPIRADDATRLVCSVCWSRAPLISAPRCPRCWDPLLAPGASCSTCAVLIPGVRCVRAAFLMESPVREIVHALKYRGWQAVAEPMAQKLARVPLPADVAAEVDAVVPVPVSAVRLRERGYNQAALLAIAYASLIERPTRPDLLLRVRATESQTALHPDERRANVSGAFSTPASGGSLDGIHLLLVDDVWTTGATALACAGTLLDAGARAVSILTFARAIPGVPRADRR